MLRRFAGIAQRAAAQIRQEMAENPGNLRPMRAAGALA
jgi:hypothetical protein